MADSDAPKRGFTLVELLIVIGIVAALAAILFPVFLAARTRAGTTTCTSNLRQLHLAFSLYAADNNGYMPPYVTRVHQITRPDGTTFIVPDQSESLVASVAPYVQAPGIWFCPADPFAGDDGVVDGYAYRNRYTSYNCLYGIVYRQGFSRLSRFDTANPTIFPLLTDKKSPGVLDLPPGTGPGPYSHGGRFNVLYRDGHIETRNWDYEGY